MKQLQINIAPIIITVNDLEFDSCIHKHHIPFSVQEKTILALQKKVAEARSIIDSIE